MHTVIIPADEIVDWPSFHDVFQRIIGFPRFYGRNMDAWVDCMTSIDSPSDGLTKVTVQPGETLALRLDRAFEFRERCRDQYDALIAGTAYVNYRRVDVGELPVLALILVGAGFFSQTSVNSPSASY